MLFVGLAVGSLSPAITLPEVIPTLGLVLFVYAMGISSGPAFFNAFRRQGSRDNALAAGVLVLGALMCFHYFGRRWRVTLEPPSEGPELVVHDFVIRNPSVMGRTIREVLDLYGDSAFVISRIQKEGRLDIARSDTRLDEGDVVAVVGDEHALQRAEGVFGAVSPTRISLDRSELDYRRVFVSRREVVGKRIRDLDLAETLSAIITRLRRGDVDIVPEQETTLEYGDRVRVLTPRANVAAVTRFFGDSLRGAAEMPVGSLAIGMVLGVIVGSLPIPLGGDHSVRLGVAGGTLLVALGLGRLERTGGISWAMPLPANLTLRQIGLLLFLAGVGTRAGYSFLDTVRHDGLQVLLAGAAVTLVVTLATLLIGRRLGIRFDSLPGLASGVQTQPACLAYADTLARSDVPSVAYAAVYPTAMIMKILLAQLLLT